MTLEPNVSYVPPEFISLGRNLPPPGVPFDVAPFTCVRVNVLWIPLILGALRALAWDFDYAGDFEDCVEAGLEAKRMLRAFMVGNVYCTEDTMYILRQNPVDPCVLEQSTDGGVTWTTAFNFRWCLQAQSGGASIEAQIQISASATATATAIAEYGGDATYIAPDLVFDLSPTDEMRNQAMCYALNLSMAMFSNVVAAVENKGFEWPSRDELITEAIKVVSGLVLALPEVAGIALNPYVALAAAATFVISDVALLILQEQEREPDFVAILDSTVQTSFACCGASNLAGATPSLAAFEQIFDNCDLSAQYPDVSAALQALVASEEYYVSFLEIVQRAFDAINSGQVFNCGCDTDYLQWDFTAQSGVEENTIYGDGGWVVPSANAGCGVHQPGVGWVAGNETTGDWTKHRGVHILREGVDGVIERCEVDFAITWSNQVTDNPGRIAYGGDTQLYSIAQIGVNGDHTIIRNAVREASLGSVQTAIFSYILGTSNPGWGGNVIIYRIRLYGQNLSA